ncbi:MAG: LuxR C-terminal-related transcriptional regulator [Mangrovibacterium sp.]
MTRLRNILAEFRNKEPLYEEDSGQLTADCQGVLDAVARTGYEMIYVFDYILQSFSYVSHNSAAFCGMSLEEVKSLGMAFYLQVLHPDDLELFYQSTQASLRFLHAAPLEERFQYIIYCSFRVEFKKKHYMTVCHKLTPLQFTSEGNISKALCKVSLTDEKKVGARIKNQEHGRYWNYNLATQQWEEQQAVLGRQERDIIVLAMQGMSTKDISALCCLSIDTIKYHQKKLYARFEVKSLQELI